MVDFVAALQAAGAAIGLVKELNQAAKAYDEALLKLKIAELAGALATVQMGLAEARTEAIKKDEEIAKLRAAFKDKSELVEHQGFSYRKRSDGTPKGDPYCSRCLQEGKLIMTVLTRDPGYPQECPVCKSRYQGLARFAYD